MVSSFIPVIFVVVLSISSPFKPFIYRTVARKNILGDQKFEFLTKVGAKLKFY